MHIYCDLDGVLVDFVRGCKKIFDWPDQPIIPHTDVADHLGISKTQFWQTIDYHGEEWWAELEPTPFADDLVDLLSFYDKEFTILTSPSSSHQAAAGKVLWLQKYFESKHFNRYVITPKRNKKRLATPNSILVDDYDENYNGFIEKGGIGILFPTCWNSNHYIFDPVEYVSEELVRIFRQS